MVTCSVNCLSVSQYFCTVVQVKRQSKCNCSLSCVLVVHQVYLLIKIQTKAWFGSIHFSKSVFLCLL